MTFELRKKNNKPYEWAKYTKNIFNNYFTNYIVFTSIENDPLLKKEFGYLLEQYKDAVYLDCKCENFTWLKKFKEAKYTVASVEPGNEYNKFKKVGFQIVGFEKEPFNRLTMIRENF